MKDEFISRVGVWGKRHYNYLKKRSPTVINVMRMKGTLEQYLTDLNRDTQETYDLLMRQYAEIEGVTDNVDLDKLKWSARGYDKLELSKIYTLSGMMAERRADLVVSSLLKYVTDIDDVKGLSFCVTVDHAEFMCRYFNEHGIPSMFLTGHSVPMCLRLSRSGQAVNNVSEQIY